MRLIVFWAINPTAKRTTDPKKPAPTPTPAACPDSFRFPPSLSVRSLKLFRSQVRGVVCIKKKTSHMARDVSPEMSSGKDLKSRCKTPFAASRDRVLIRAGETTLIRKGVGAAPPKLAYSLRFPSRKKLPPCLPVSALRRDAWGPGRAPVGCGGQQGRPLLGRAPPPGVGGGKEETRSRPSRGPSARTLDIGQSPQVGVSLNLPPCQGLPGLYDGPDLRSILPPLLHHPLPLRVSKGPSKLSLDPHPHPCQQGPNSRGIPYHFGARRRLGGSDQAHRPGSYLPAHS